VLCRSSCRACSCFGLHSAARPWASLSTALCRKCSCGGGFSHRRGLDASLKHHETITHLVLTQAWTMSTPLRTCVRRGPRRRHVNQVQRERRVDLCPPERRAQHRRAADRRAHVAAGAPSQRHCRRQDLYLPPHGCASLNPCQRATRVVVQRCNSASHPALQTEPPVMVGQQIAITLSVCNPNKVTGMSHGDRKVCRV